MASDMVRITGMNSGLDTEAIIGAYTSVHSERVKSAKNSLTLNKWTQTAWKDLNSKIYGFYTKTLSTMRMTSAYKKSKTTTSNGALSVVSGSNAVNGVQTAKIKSTASAAYLTGSEVSLDGDKVNLNEALGIDSGKQITFSDNKGNTKTIQIGGVSVDGSATVVNDMSELVSAFKDAGINANFDAGNKRLFLSAKETGESNDFKLSGDNETLAKLGLASQAQIDELGEDNVYKAASKIDGSSAELELNGATFKSDSNTFSINGSTYQINYMPSNPDETISINTQDDYEGVYDAVKGILKEYNELVSAMAKAYNADSAKGYKPLTDEQKEQMSDKEIEEWENKIKDSLLRNDENLYGILNAMTNSFSAGFEIDGKTMYLSDFGISTQGYFSAEKNERYNLHIDGDTSDEVSAGNADKLKAMISSAPEKVAEFFSSLAGKMYDDIYSKMGSSSLSSIYKVYNDKQLKNEQTEWEKKITDLESKLKDIEDKYYKKFAAMEKLMGSLNSTQTSLSSFFG